MRAEELAHAVRELDENARATLREQILTPLEEAPVAERALIAQSAYGAVLARLAEAPIYACEERADGSSGWSARRPVQGSTLMIGQGGGCRIG